MNFLISQNVETRSGGPTSHHFNGYPGSLPGVKRPEREANLSSGEIVNGVIPLLLSFTFLLLDGLSGTG